MAKSRWDECCPHCEVKIADINTRFCRADYSQEFDMECPHCERRFGVRVEHVPSFEFTAETNEEQERRHFERIRARHAAMATNPNPELRGLP